MVKIYFAFANVQLLLHPAIAHFAVFLSFFYFHYASSYAVKSILTLSIVWRLLLDFFLHHLLPHSPLTRLIIVGTRLQISNSQHQCLLSVYVGRKNFHFFGCFFFLFVIFSYSFLYSFHSTILTILFNYRCNFLSFFLSLLFSFSFGIEKKSLDEFSTINSSLFPPSTIR